MGSEQNPTQDLLTMPVRDHLICPFQFRKIGEEMFPNVIDLPLSRKKSSTHQEHLICAERTAVATQKKGTHDAQSMKMEAGIRFQQGFSVMGKGLESIYYFGRARYAFLGSLKTRNV